MKMVAGDERVFFFPHSYLRDRQIDTIRQWQGCAVVNPEIVSRPGAQVSRGEALARRRRSWKRMLPLINIKRRPTAAPTDAVVYLWSGIIANGPFITDIDNPFAFTAYNVAATCLYRPLIRFLLLRESCRSIQCMSKACQQGLAGEYGSKVAGKSNLAYPSVDIQSTGVPSSKPGACRFLFVGTQFEIKGGPALLRAFRQVHNNFPGARLDLVTHLPARFEKEARDCPGLHVHGANYTREEIASRFLSQTDVLVHPTYMESFGMVILEAISCGLPIIATDIYAIPEMVEHDSNGFLIKPPVSSWNGLKPDPEFFTDTIKLRRAVEQLDTSRFEDQLTGFMLAFAKDSGKRRSAGAKSLDIANTKFGRNQ